MHRPEETANRMHQGKVRNGRAGHRPLATDPGGRMPPPRLDQWVLGLGFSQACPEL